VIGGMKHRCCSSEDANVTKINFMQFNPGPSLAVTTIQNWTGSPSTRRRNDCKWLVRAKIVRKAAACL
jgi:hypothetical protein